MPSRLISPRLQRSGRHAWQLVQRSVSGFIEHDGPQAAAAVSYFGLFSLFPLAILTVALYGLLIGGEEARERVIDFVLNNVPLEKIQGSREIRRALSTVTSKATAFGVVGVATLVFAASGLMGAIRGAFNAAWDVSDPRPPLRGKFLDIVLVLGAGLVIALSMGLTFLSRLAVSAGAELKEALGVSALPEVMVALAQLTPVLVSFAVFAFLYRVVPAADVRLSDVWPGALIAALGFEVTKTGFSLYLRNFADYGAVYGSLATVVAFLVFVFLAANVMVVGAEAASEWRGVRAGREDATEAAGPQLSFGERVRGFLRGLVRRE